MKLASLLSKWKLPALFISIATCALLLAVIFTIHPFVKHQEPNFLTFQELKALSRHPKPGWFLARKLQQFWRTPIISNEAYYRGAKPYRPRDPKLGPYLRLVSWNIEKSYEMQHAISAFSSAQKFESLIDPAKAPRGSSVYQNLLRQREKLANADVIVLQEMDIGVKRSNYIDAARELAKALDMNYTYGAEQLEIDPVYLGLEKINYADGTIDQEATDYYAVDPVQYKGVFGCAVLSRYPIKQVQVFQLKNQAYDWYRGEEPKIGFVEKTRRAGAKTVFKNVMTREMKAGGRIYFRVDLAVPGVPGGTVTIINIHLEIKCQPKGREAQMAEIFSYIKNIKSPTVVVGDFNSAPHDLSPTSAWRVTERLAKNPETWVSVGTSLFLPHALLLNASRLTTRWTKNLQDPTAKNIPVVLPNPVKPLFDMIENYRFNDGGAFDFRGDMIRSISGNDGTLANSNERDLKGFKTTFSVKRPVAVVIGKYRLDWVFVKSFLKDPRDRTGSYRFAPHFGETLEEMNTSLLTPISDHHPNVVDIPFEEPQF
ncbi:MAG: endonuclease/exonuclease/phosphatase family protein [Candidatus Omnitrophica bacterium]|nr:endonuclease/exonuclease/phosphatase family protein [Candidatus Omnitrophota bacterium]